MLLSRFCSPLHGLLHQGARSWAQFVPSHCLFACVIATNCWILICLLPSGCHGCVFCPCQRSIYFSSYHTHNYGIIGFTTTKPLQMLILVQANCCFCVFYSNLNFARAGFSPSKLLPLLILLQLGIRNCIFHTNHLFARVGFIPTSFLLRADFAQSLLKHIWILGKGCAHAIQVLDCVCTFGLACCGNLCARVSVCDCAGEGRLVIVVALFKWMFGAWFALLKKHVCAGYLFGKQWCARGCHPERTTVAPCDLLSWQRRIQVARCGCHGLGWRRVMVDFFLHRMLINWVGLCGPRPS